MNAETFARYARYYNSFYRDKDYVREARFVDGLLRTAGVAGGPLLDVGCGTGAHAREFCKLGWRVHGVDLSPGMITIARESTRPETGIEFSVGSAAEFQLEQRFDAVVSLFHVASYQAQPGEAGRMFANVRRHLGKGGVFAFDFWHGPGVLAEPPAVRVYRREENGKRLTRIAEPVHHRDDRTVAVNYELLIEDIATSRLERVCETHLVRYFSLPEIQELLRTADFALANAYAGMTEAKLHPEAWHALVVAQAE